MVEGLDTKPYLIENASYTNRDYLLCNFKLVDKNLDEIMFD
jgi:hypothetical protein